MKKLLGVMTALLVVGCAQTYQHHVPVQSGEVTGEHARVRIPKEVEVLRVDGTRLQTRSLLPMRESHVLLLEPGNHRITARPRAAMDVRDEEHAVTMGAAVMLQFDVVADAIYRIVYHPDLKPGDDDVDRMWVELLSDD